MKQTRTAITPAQAAARRANGKLSHRPVTDADKAASSQNALKFGFFARNPLLPGESPEEFAAFRASLFESYQPVGGAEVMLVERLLLHHPAQVRASDAVAAQEAQAAERRQKQEAQNEPTDCATRLSTNDLRQGNPIPPRWEREHPERQALYRRRELRKKPRPSWPCAKVVIETNSS